VGRADFRPRISARRIAGLSQAVDGEDIDQNDERAAFVVECATDSAGSRIFRPKTWPGCRHASSFPRWWKTVLAARNENGPHLRKPRGWRKNLPAMAAAGSPSSSAALAQTGYGLDVDRLLSALPVELLDEWRELYDLEPWDAERTDLAAGVAGDARGGGRRRPAPPAGRLYARAPPRPGRAGAEAKPAPERTMKAAWDTICKVMDRKGTPHTPSAVSGASPIVEAAEGCEKRTGIWGFGI